MSVEYWSQKNAIVGAIDPASATGTSTSDVIDLKLWGRVTFVVYTGTQTTTGDVTLTIEEGTSTSSFNTTTALATLAIGANKDNDQYIYEVHDTKLSATYRYIRAKLLQDTATGLHGLIAIADQARYHPASDNDHADVTSITVAT